jgi:hypothetical protein
MDIGSNEDQCEFQFLSALLNATVEAELPAKAGKITFTSP